MKTLFFGKWIENHFSIISFEYRMLNLNFYQISDSSYIEIKLILIRYTISCTEQCLCRLVR